jgi:bifunctional non-homologous end joining protein LigD
MRSSAMEKPMTACFQASLMPEALCLSATGFVDQGGEGRSPCYHPTMLSFVQPATPVMRSAPPQGYEWLHEVKFDGWRVQLHKYGKFVQLYTRGGHKAARRFSDLVAALARIPARSCVIDGEVVACNTRGLPDFHALHFRRDGREVCVWAFDLL